MQVYMYMYVYHVQDVASLLSGFMAVRGLTGIGISRLNQDRQGCWWYGFMTPWRSCLVGVFIACSNKRYITVSAYHACLLVAPFSDLQMMARDNIPLHMSQYFRVRKLSEIHTFRHGLFTRLTCTVHEGVSYLLIGSGMVLAMFTMYAIK